MHKDWWSGRWTNKMFKKYVHTLSHTYKTILYLSACRDLLYLSFSLASFIYVAERFSTSHFTSGPTPQKPISYYHILASVPPVSSQSDDLYNPFSTTSCYSYSVNEPKRVGGGPCAMALNDINVKELCWKEQGTYKRKRIIFQVLRREGRHQPCGSIRVWPRQSAETNCNILKTILLLLGVQYPLNSPSVFIFLWLITQRILKTLFLTSLVEVWETC